MQEKAVCILQHETAENVFIILIDQFVQRPIILLYDVEQQCHVSVHFDDVKFVEFVDANQCVHRILNCVIICEVQELANVSVKRFKAIRVEFKPFAPLDYRIHIYVCTENYFDAISYSLVV